jgi:hypothetical protein
LGALRGPLPGGMMSDTIDQLDLLKGTFDKLGIKYEQYVEKDHHGYATGQTSLDLIDNRDICEFWFIDGKFDNILIHRN